MRGKAVRVLHIFGDLLCMKWNRSHPLNKGFTLSRIYPLAPIHGDIDNTEYVDDVAVRESTDTAEQSHCQASDESNISNGVSTSKSISNCISAARDTDPLKSEPEVGFGIETSGVEGKAIDQHAVCDIIEAPAMLDLQLDSINLSDVVIDVEYDSDKSDTHEAVQNAPDLSLQKNTDLVLEVCLLRALFYIVKDKGLPQLSSTFWLIVMR